MLNTNYYRTAANAEAKFALRYEALAKKLLRKGDRQFAILAARSARNCGGESCAGTTTTSRRWKPTCNTTRAAQEFAKRR